MSEPRPDPDLAPLRAAYRDLQAPGSAACPPAEALAELAIDGGIEKSPVGGHVLGCRKCSDDLQILLRTHAEASGHEAGRAVRRRLAAFAAAVAVALGGLVLLERSRRDTPDPGVERGAAADVASRVAPRESAELDRAPEEFAWPPQGGAEGYRVKLFDRSGRAVWETDAGASTRVSFPAERSSELAKGDYFWIVEVGPAADRRRLGPFRFAIR